MLGITFAARRSFLLWSDLAEGQADSVRDHGESEQPLRTLEWFAYRLLGIQGVGQQLIAVRGAVTSVPGTQAQQCVRLPESAVVLSILGDVRLGTNPGRPSVQQHRLLRQLAQDARLSLSGVTVRFYNSQVAAYTPQHARALLALKGSTQPLLVRDYSYDPYMQYNPPCSQSPMYSPHPLAGQ
jgi:hypothetical protein